MDIAQSNGRVDGTGDENDGNGNAKRNLGDGCTSGEQSRRLNVGSNKCVAQSSSQSVDGDLNKTRSPN